MIKKENKKLMEVFFVHRQQGSQFPLSIYILTVHRGTQIIFMGFGGVGTLPQMLNRGIGSHPNDTNKRFVFSR